MISYFSHLWFGDIEYSIRGVAYILEDASNDKVYNAMQCNAMQCNARYKRIKSPKQSATWNCLNCVLYSLILFAFCPFKWTWQLARLSDWSSLFALVMEVVLYFQALCTYHYCVLIFVFELELYSGTLPLTHKAQGKRFETEQRHAKTGLPNW